METVRIRTRLNGPLVIEGPVEIVDHQGNAFALPTDKPKIALCRCGQSRNKPFCDGAHKECNFVGDDVAVALPDQHLTNVDGQVDR